MDAKRADLAKNSLLSVDGKADELKKFASTQRAIFLRVRSAAADTRTKLQNDRDALIPKAIDKTDAAGAALRVEYRRIMRATTVTESIALASTITDPSLITAIWESDPALSGLDTRSRDVITANWLETNRAKQIRALDDRAEVVDLVEMAVNLTQGALFTAAGVRSAAEFEAWLGS
ncbi:hypothetical protein ACFQZO_35475 [Bradyrhizobium sp. GCM10027634]|uniref:hypothetical protein n=1 Tax=unclassified Bradyrhizobium TaxID=2631580 RepID=UPI00188BF6D0|nr:MULTISPECIES: hypothetical protein [unclassified Bradyrhizobium]MDN5006153.1 hypothetical protein [Bradyrhizobium sp. WYCCWR 12677]